MWNVRGLALLGMLPLLAACAASPELEISSVALSVEAGANNDTPIRVDLALVADQKLLAELLKVSAADWFKRKSQYQRDYPDQLSVFEWEIVPNRKYSIDLPERPAAWAGLVFAGYASPGEHRLITRESTLKLRFSESDFVPLP